MYNKDYHRELWDDEIYIYPKTDWIGIITLFVVLAVIGAGFILGFKLI